MATTEATKVAKKRKTFSLKAPEATSVTLAGDFNNWETERNRLRKQANGSWKTQLSLAPGTYRYRFLVDGEWTNDPRCETRATNQFGTEDCILVVE